MRNYIVSAMAVLIFVVGLASVSVNAQSTECVSVQVPFAFRAANKVLAEGKYQVCPANASQNAFSLQNGKRRTLGFVNPTAIDWYDDHQLPGLVFHRYGNEYFLFEIRSSFVVAKLHQSRIEKELRRNISSREAGRDKPRPEVVTVFASPAPGKTKSS